MRKYKKIFCLLTLSCSLACSPNSSQEFQKAGEEQCLSLLKILQSIETSDQLLSAEPVLKNKFESLVALMIESSRFQQEHPDEWQSESVSEVSFVSTSLKEELSRIYLIEGGREVIERAELESLVKLDAYERSRLKQREKLKEF